MSAVAEPLAAEPPILHTVEEAAGLLRIGRTLAYSWLVGTRTAAVATVCPSCALEAASVFRDGR